MSWTVRLVSVKYQVDFSASQPVLHYLTTRNLDLLLLLAREFVVAQGAIGDDEFERHYNLAQAEVRDQSFKGNLILQVVIAYKAQ